MRMKIASLLLFAGSAIIYSCRQDSEPVVPWQPPAYAPHAMQISYPAWVTTYAGAMPAPGSNPTTREGVELGRQLFYEKMLSDNQTMSCASCHKQENGFSDPRNFSEGTNGAKGDRNAMAVINLGWDSKFFWDGRRNSLEEQAHDPVTNMIEMRNTWPVVVSRLQNNKRYPNLFYKAFGTYKIDSNLVVKAIAQFERTLVSFNSRFDKFYFEGDSTALDAMEKKGLEIFFGKGGCNHCHSDVLLTDNAIRNNGLDVTFTDKGLGKVTGNSTDNGKFRVPTLRNIAQSAPYMHDSRFSTLEQVVEQYNSGIKSNSPNLDVNMDEIKNGLLLSNPEKLFLVAFLKSLTDSSFLTNPSFSDPNK